MIPLNELLMLKFPEARFPFDISLHDHGDGEVVIGEWNINAPRPTEKDISLWQNAPDLVKMYNDKIVSFKRQSEYPPLKNLIIALWEKEILGDSTKANILQAEREIVDEKYPEENINNDNLLK